MLIRSYVRDDDVSPVEVELKQSLLKVGCNSSITTIPVTLG